MIIIKNRIIDEYNAITGISIVEYVLGINVVHLLKSGKGGYHEFIY